MSSVTSCTWSEVNATCGPGSGRTPVNSKVARSPLEDSTTTCQVFEPYGAVSNQTFVFQWPLPSAVVVAEPYWETTSTTVPWSATYRLDTPSVGGVNLGF